MSDEHADSATESPAQGSEESGKTYTQDQVEKIVKTRLSDFDTYKQKAEQFDALTNSMSEAQEEATDWRSKAENYEAELSWRDTLLMRQEVAAQKGLDPRLWDRIKGESREEIEADIGELQGFVTTSSRRPTPLRSGASADGATTAKERAAQALRGAREAR